MTDRFTTDDSTIISLAQWQQSTGQDADSIIALPTDLFVNVAANDYHLKAGSPAIGTGTRQDAPTDDLDGHPRPTRGRVDIGAYQYQNSPPVRQPVTAVPLSPPRVLAPDAPDGDQTPDEQ